MNHGQSKQGRRRKYLEKQTKNLIDELKKSSRVYDDLIIYSMLNKVFNKGKLFTKNTRTTRSTQKVPVIKIDGNTNTYYKSLADAESKTGIKATSISMVINGHRKKAGGFIWKPKRKS